MEKCRFCGAELEEELTLCSACGKDNAEEVSSAEETPEAAEAIQEEANLQEEAPEETEAASEEAPDQEEKPAEIQEGSAKVTPGKLALAVAAVIALVALIVGLLVAGKKEAPYTPEPTQSGEISAQVQTEPTTPPTAPADTGLNDETCKGSYYVSDEEALTTGSNVVATLGGKELTNAELQVHYWSYVSSYISSEYGYQAMMAGLIDLARPMDTQMSMADPNLTWQQYFLKCALQNWQSLQSMSLEAQSLGYTMGADAEAALEAIPGNLETMAADQGLESVEELLRQNMGAGVTVEDFVNYQRTYYEGAPYYEEGCAAITVTDEEIETFFNENEQAYADQGLTRDERVVDVRHVLIMPEGATSETIRSETFPDEVWAASEKKAQELLDSWLAGDHTEESFAVLANENTDDGNDANGDGVKDGGLYTGVTKGQMVEAFENWCFDETRQPGDTGIVKTEFGYHIMYFVKGEEVWPYYAEQDLIAVKENEFLMGIIEKYPMEVDYNAIALADIIVG